MYDIYYPALAEWVSSVFYSSIIHQMCEREKKGGEHSLDHHKCVTLQYYDLLYMKCLYISNNSLKPWELVLPEPQHANSQPDLGCCNYCRKSPCNISSWCCVSPASFVVQAISQKLRGVCHIQYFSGMTGLSGQNMSLK